MDPVNWGLGSACGLARGLWECLCAVVRGPGGEGSVVPSKVFCLSFPKESSPLGGCPLSASLAWVCRFRWEPGETRMELLSDFAKERGAESGGWASESHITGCPPSHPRPGGTSPIPVAQDQLSIPGVVCPRGSRLSAADGTPAGRPKPLQVLSPPVQGAPGPALTRGLAPGLSVLEPFKAPSDTSRPRQVGRG